MCEEVPMEVAVVFLSIIVAALTFALVFVGVLKLAGRWKII